MNGEGTLAGYVGRVSKSSILIRNSKFEGSFEGANSTGNGGFISWVDENSSATIENCLFEPTAINTKFDKCETWARKDNSGKVTVTNSYATREYGNPEDPSPTMTAEQQVEALGKEYWEVVDGKAVPKPKTLTETTDGEGDAALVNLATWTKVGDTMVPPMTTTADVSYSTINDPNLKDLFYHSGTGKIDKQLLAETRQSSVVLTWNTDGNPIDYFIVYRREAGQGDNDWKEIATNLDQMTYEDKTVSPLKKYQYKVLATSDCEGNHTSETSVADGACKNTGRLEGYVRFNDGTGIADVVVNISSGSVNIRSPH